MTDVGEEFGATRENRRVALGRGDSVEDHASTRATRPDFVDMTGQTLAGVEVVRRARNSHTGARWRCRCLACGAQSVQYGFYLRKIARQGGRVRCGDCAPLSPKMEARRAQLPKVDGMMGMRVGGGVVTGRTSNVNGDVTWSVAMPCGHTIQRAGVYLRKSRAIGRQMRCEECATTARRGRSSRFCPLCCGLPHRVVGATCRHCGLAFREGA